MRPGFFSKPCTASTSSGCSRSKLLLLRPFSLTVSATKTQIKAKTGTVNANVLARSNSQDPAVHGLTISQLHDMTIGPQAHTICGENDQSSFIFCTTSPLFNLLTRSDRLRLSPFFNPLLLDAKIKAWKPMPIGTVIAA